MMATTTIIKRKNKIKRTLIVLRHAIGYCSRFYLCTDFYASYPYTEHIYTNKNLTTPTHSGESVQRTPKNTIAFLKQHGLHGSSGILHIITNKTD